MADAGRDPYDIVFEKLLMFDREAVDPDRVIVEEV